MLSYLVWLVVLIVVFHIFVYHQYHWPGFYKLINKIPGPPGVFFFGSTLKYYILKNEGSDTTPNGGCSRQQSSSVPLPNCAVWDSKLEVNTKSTKKGQTDITRNTNNDYTEKNFHASQVPAILLDVLTLTEGHREKQNPGIRSGIGNTQKTRLINMSFGDGSSHCWDISNRQQLFEKRLRIIRFPSDIITHLKSQCEPFMCDCASYFFAEMLPDVMNNFKIYGPTFRSWYSGIPVVMVSRLDDIQTILGCRHNNSKGTLYKHILPWLGTGLLTSSGEKWHKMRKIITPTFHFSILHGYIDIFNKNTQILMEVLAKEENSADVYLAKFVTYCTLDIVCETAMGVKLESLTNGGESKYVQAIFRIGKIVVHRLFSPIIFTDHNFWLTPMGREHSGLLKTLHGFTSRIIKEKRCEIQNKIIDPMVAEAESVGSTTKKSFLEMLLENQVSHNLTDKDIREEVDTFMFEGHDTTSASLNWALFELGHHTNVQEKVYEEMQTIFGESDRLPTYNDLMQMSYLKRVIQEVLRLYPSVPVISRKFDIEIQIKDYLIPANTEIILALYCIHRNPEIFPEPEKFDPDRFLPEEMEKRHPFAYIPFSAGHRNCIGQKFAMLEELVILSSIIRKYRIVSLDERDSVKVVPEMILRSNKTLKWKITKR